jgi:hypothetical protein
MRLSLLWESVVSYAYITVTDIGPKGCDGRTNAALFRPSSID